MTNFRPENRARYTFPIFKIVVEVFHLLPSNARLRLFGLIPLMIVATIFEMVGLALIAPLVNTIMETQALGELPFVSGLNDFFRVLAGPNALILMASTVALFYLFKNVFLFSAFYIENRFVMSVVRDAATSLLAVYMSAPHAYHLRHNSAELVRNISSSVDDTFRGVMRPMIRIASEGLVILGVVLVLIVADPLVTIVMSIFLGILMGGFFLLTHRRILLWGRGMQALQRETLQALNEIFGGLKEMRILGRQPFFLNRFLNIRREMSRVYALHQSISELPRLMIETLLIFAFALALILIFLRGDQGAQVLPLLALYALAGFRLMPSFNRIMLYANSIRFSSASLHNVLAHRHELKEVQSQIVVVAANDRLPFCKEIIMENVTFAYEGGRAPAIKDINLRIERGQSVGLIGQSGAGKSTLADVLLGLIEPQCGRVLVDGIPIAGQVGRWQRNIGYIPQQIYLLDDTLRRNIALGIIDSDIDDSCLNKAIRLAHLENLVARLPEGSDTVLGENGTKFSGGQRQRAGIARALYSSPAFLIMDEATSALDGETEREISAAINELAGERTLLVIAHRISTIRNCDTVVLMHDGRIVDIGTYDELYGRRQEFRILVTLGTADGVPASGTNTRKNYD